MYNFAVKINGMLGLTQQFSSDSGASFRYGAVLVSWGYGTVRLSAVDERGLLDEAGISPMKLRLGLLRGYYNHYGYEVCGWFTVTSGSRRSGYRTTPHRHVLNADEMPKNIYYGRNGRVDRVGIDIHPRNR